MPKVYRAFAKCKNTETGERRTRASWYTSRVNKTKTEKEIKSDPKLEDYDSIKITHKEFDIPSGKAGLVEFLNKYCIR